MMTIFIIVVVIVQLIVRQTQEQQRSTKTTKKPNNKKNGDSRCLSRYTGYPCVIALLTNWLLYASTKDRHRHQRTFSHCSYHTFPLDHAPRLVAVTRTRTVFASRAFSVAAPTVWNSLPDNVVNLDTLATFKKRLKTHLFH